MPTATISTHPIFVLFGRPGSGKSTVADQAAVLFQERSSIQQSQQQSPKMLPVERIDLDVCVPQWMRDNFSKGIYPTIQERAEFANACCDHVEQSMRNNNTNTNELFAAVATLVSFSFVNSDLRDIFRRHFPHAQWILLCTAPDEAQRRIDQRQGHFYKRGPNQPDAMDRNAEWEFAPVTFSHYRLDGLDSVDQNAVKLVDWIRTTVLGEP